MVVYLGHPKVGTCLWIFQFPLSVTLSELGDRNWEVQAVSPDKIFDKTCLYV